MFKKSWLALSAIALCIPAQGYGETLPQAVSTTLQNHPQIEGALAVLHSAEETEKEQFSGYFPELSVGATGGRIFGDNSTSRGLSTTRGTGYSYLWEGTISARQPLFDGMETRNRVAAAKAEKKASEVSVVDVKGALSYSTVQTYLSLLQAYRALALLGEQDKIVRQYLSRIETMVEDGAADEAELQQARDVLVTLDNAIADYKGQARTLEASYRELTGSVPVAALEAPRLSKDWIPVDVDAAVSVAKAEHPLLRVARYQSRAAQYGVEAERGGLFPDVDGELSYLKSDKADVIGGEAIDARAVVRMNWNFETGGAQMARIRQRTYEHKESLSRVADAERQVERGVRQAYAELETAQRQLKNQKERQVLQAKLLETYKVQFEGSLISVLQLMQADNQAFLRRLEASNAANRVLVAQYGILAAMGNLQDALGVELASAYPSHQK